MRRDLVFAHVITGLIRASSVPVAGHEGEDGHTPWLLWAELAVLVLGVGLFSVGVYLDQSREHRIRYADYLLIGGFLLAVLGGVGLYL